MKLIKMAALLLIFNLGLANNKSNEMIYSGNDSKITIYSNESSHSGNFEQIFQFCFGGLIKYKTEMKNIIIEDDFISFTIKPSLNELEFLGIDKDSVAPYILKISQTQLNYEGYFSADSLVLTSQIDGKPVSSMQSKYLRVASTQVGLNLIIKNSFNFKFYLFN